MNLLKTGVVGLGDMGSGLAKNLMTSGHCVTGFDTDPKRLEAFANTDKSLCAAARSAREVGLRSAVVFVMVMNGDQARTVILGNDGTGGLRASMASGGCIVLTATVQPREAELLADELKGSGIHFIDSPVSGGYPGAQAGTLTLMAAGSDGAFSVAGPALEAISGTIHRVGSTPGTGQTVKACLQSVIGSVFAAVFEAATLAAKSGIRGDVFHKVVSTSSAGCGVANTALANIIDRAFQGTGSHIATMHKDLTISLNFAREMGVPLFTAATAMQLFQAGKTRYPDGDNWVVTRVLEEIVGAELHR